MTTEPSRARMTYRSGKAQRGAALMFALLMVAVMLVVTGTALETAQTEMRVAANMRDRNAALEGAEAAALQSIAHLDRLAMSGRGQPDNSAGYYLSGQIPVDGVISEVDNAPSDFWHGFGLTEGNSFTGSLVSGASGQSPGRYLIERLQADDEGEPTSATAYPLVYSRVTVWAPGGQGANVTLQTIVRGVP
jgi:Tfp pilus assembly protein PilX